MARLLGTIVCLVSLVHFVAAASSWSFEDAAVAVGPKGKDAIVSFSFNTNSAVEEAIELTSSDTLRLTFTATDDGKASRPHQSFILVEDTVSQLDTIVPVLVKPSGKGKVDIDHRDLPPQLLYADSLKLSLIIASFGESNPLNVQFASLKPLTASSQKPDAPERWAPKQEIEHTFRAPQKLPNKGLSGLFAVAVVAGLPIFLIFLFFASANVSSWSTAIGNATLAHSIFFACLLGFEIRFFKYWRCGTVGQILMESSAIAVIAFLSGRSALGEVMRRRSSAP